MGDILIFILHCVFFIGVVITTLFLNEYSFILAMGFDALYIISVKLLCKELENQ